MQLQTGRGTDVQVSVPFETQAHQEYVLGLKLHWTRRLYPALRDEYLERSAAAPCPLQTADEVEQLMADSTLYQYFGWLERHLQHMKYTHRRWTTSCATRGAFCSPGPGSFRWISITHPAERSAPSCITVTRSATTSRSCGRCANAISPVC